MPSLIVAAEGVTVLLVVPAFLSAYAKVIAVTVSPPTSEPDKVVKLPAVAVSVVVPSYCLLVVGAVSVTGFGVTVTLPVPWVIV